MKDDVILNKAKLKKSFACKVNKKFFRDLILMSFRLVLSKMHEKDYEEAKDANF